MKPLIVYHKSCADGFGAAFAAWRKFGDEAEYIPMQYGDTKSHQEFEGRVFEARNAGTPVDVYILDFSFARETMEVIMNLAQKCVWLDHHKTAFENWYGDYQKGLLFQDGDITLDDNRSGALIAWNYFFPDEQIPMMFKYLDDYDRWVFQYPNTKNYNKALWSHTPWEFKQWDDWFRMEHLPQHLERFIDEGKSILRAHDQNVMAVVKSTARPCVIESRVSGVPSIERFLGLASNCPSHLQSDVGHQLANQSGTYGLLWGIDKDGKCKCSLRSNGAYDVSALARLFGGGGHRNAAGFETDIKTLLQIIGC
jgi:oligoribonuclease NrnB/cAMP/cGMP phosphodiesterase (DHH superfamily)